MNTLTTTVIPRNDPPSGVACGIEPFTLTYIDSTFGSMTFVGEVQDNTRKLTFEVGNGLLKTQLLLSDEQYLAFRSLLSTSSKSWGQPHEFLLPLAYMCFEQAIAFESRVESSEMKATLKAFSRRDYCGGECEALIPWLPLNELEELGGLRGSPDYFCDALVLRISDLLPGVPRHLDESSLQNLLTGLDDCRVSVSRLEEFRSLRLLVGVIVACVESRFTEKEKIPGAGWPSAAFEPLLELAALPYLETDHRISILRNAIQTLQKGGESIPDSAKAAVLKFIADNIGVKWLFSQGGRYADEFLEIREFRELLGIEEPHALITCLREISIDVARLFDRRIDAAWVKHWEAFSSDAKEHFLTRLRNEPELFNSELFEEGIPAEICRLISSPEVIGKIIKTERGLEFIADNLSLLRKLPPEAYWALLESGHQGEVVNNLGSFLLKVDDVSSLIRKMIDIGDVGSLIPMLPNFSQSALKKVVPEGRKLLAFRAQSKVLAPSIYEEYSRVFDMEGEKAAKTFVDNVWEMLDHIVSPAPVPPEVRDHFLYNALVEYAFPRNSEFSLGFSTCKDQSDDLELFEIPEIPVELQLTSAVTMTVRNGLKLEPSVVQRMGKLLHEPLRLSEAEAESREKLGQRTIDLIKAVVSDCDDRDVTGAMINALTAVAEGHLPGAKIKRAAISYHAFRHRNFRQQAADSQERSERANNREYAHLLELRSFFTTSVKDSLREAISGPDTDAEMKDRLLNVANELFDEEIEALDKELSKFVAKGDDGREVRRVSAFFSKNERSAGMRQVAGVCVAEDNPRPEELSDNMWEMENYMQLVLRDDATRRCVGGVLLHYYEEPGERILTASLNPSSSFLYKVDEETLFAELLRVLGEFAASNDIDVIAVSEDEGIRTNRTGGLFERALDTQIRLVNEKISLVKEEVFSHRPFYEQKELDVILRLSDPGASR